MGRESKSPYRVHTYRPDPAALPPFAVLSSFSPNEHIHSRDSQPARVSTVVMTSRMGRSGSRFGREASHRDVTCSWEQKEEQQNIEGLVKAENGKERGMFKNEKDLN